MMTMESKGENWMFEFVLPGVFTLVLTVCLFHLGYCMVQAQMQQSQAASYAISAFAN